MGQPGSEEIDYPTEFAKRLDWLMDKYRSPDGDPFNYNEIALGTEGKVSAAYVRRLHIGEVGNPTVRVLKALAEFFDVPATYFLEESENTLATEKRGQATDATGGHAVLQHITARAGDFDEEDWQVLEDIIEYVRKQSQAGKA